MENNIPERQSEASCLITDQRKISIMQSDRRFTRFAEDELRKQFSRKVEIHTRNLQSANAEGRSFRLWKGRCGRIITEAIFKKKQNAHMELRKE